MFLGRKSSIKDLHSTLKRETIQGVFLLNRRKVAIGNNVMVTDFGRITVRYDGMSMVFQWYQTHDGASNNIFENKDCIFDT